MRPMRRVVSILSVAALLMILAPPGRADPQVVWHETLGGGLHAVARGSDGSIYVAGERAAGSPYRGPMLISKLTPGGDVVWSRTWRPKPNRPNAFSTGAVAIDVAETGVAYVTGYVQRWNCEGGGWFVRAYGPAGRLLHAFGARRSWLCREAPERTSDVAVRHGTVVVTGYEYGCCGFSNFRDGWVRAFDARLHPLWEAPFEPAAPTPVAWVDAAQSVAIGALGNIVVSGWAATEPIVTEGTNPVGTLILEKIAADGTVLWVRRPGLGMGRFGECAIAARNGRVMVTATVFGGGAWLGRFGVNGDLVWSRSWGADPGRRVRPSAVAISASGVTWVAGTKRDPRDGGRDIFLRRFGRSGDLLSTMALQDGARWLASGGLATFGRGVLVTGSTTDREGFEFQGGHLWRIAA